MERFFVCYRAFLRVLALAALLFVIVYGIFRLEKGGGVCAWLKRTVSGKEERYEDRLNFKDSEEKQEYAFEFCEDEIVL